MKASAREVPGLEPLPAERVELGDERRARPLAVASGPGDFALVPVFEARLVAREDQADTAGEAAPLALDDVAEHFLGAPLAGRRMPRQDVIGQRLELGANRRGRALEQPGDLARYQRSGVLGHRRVSSRAITTRWIWFVPS